MLQEPIKIQLSLKGTTLTIKMERSAIHELIGSNKISANKRKKNWNLIATLLTFPEWYSPEYNKLYHWSVNLLQPKSYCPKLNKFGQINQRRIISE